MWSLACFLHFHSIEQIYDDTSSSALVCRRCDYAKNIEIFEKGQFGNRPNPGVLDIPSIPDRKVGSVVDELSLHLTRHEFYGRRINC